MRRLTLDEVAALPDFSVIGLVMNGSEDSEPHLLVLERGGGWLAPGEFTEITLEMIAKQAASNDQQPVLLWDHNWMGRL